MTHTDSRLKPRFRYRVKSLVTAECRERIKVLFDTFSFKKKYYIVNCTAQKAA